MYAEQGVRGRLPRGLPLVAVHLGALLVLCGVPQPGRHDAQPNRQRLLGPGTRPPHCLWVPVLPQHDHLPPEEADQTVATHTNMGKRKQWVADLPPGQREALDLAMHLWRLDAIEAESLGEGEMSIAMHPGARLDFEELKKLYGLVHDVVLVPGDPAHVILYCKSTLDIQAAREASTERKLKRATKDGSFRPPLEGIGPKKQQAMNELTMSIVRSLDCEQCRGLLRGPDACDVHADVQTLILSDLVAAMRDGPRARVWVILEASSMRILVHM